MITISRFLSCFSYEDYYQVINEFSFNLKNRELNNSNVLDNFERAGDLIVLNDHIKLAPKINDSNGILSTRGEIYSAEIELQLLFRISNHESEYGSVFGIYFYTDLNGEIDVKGNHAGFKVK